MKSNWKSNIAVHWKLAALIVGVFLLGAIAYSLRTFGDPMTRTGRAALEQEDLLRARNSTEAQQAGLRSLTLANMNRLIESSEQATPKIMMAQYRLYYRYPPFSRPLSPKMVDLLDPFTIHPDRKPLYENNPPKPGEKPAYFHSWSGPTYLVTGDKPAVAVLELYEPDSDRLVKFSVLTSDMHADRQFGGVKIGEASYSDDGTGADQAADDGKMTYSWKPTPGRRLDWGEVTLLSKIKTADGKTFQVGIDFNSTPNPPAFFTNEMRESLQQGSLVLSVEMDVRQEGKYIIEGNLFDEDDRPLHWVYLNRYLNKGRQFVDLTFFGLIFHDKDFNGGRVVLRNLRGHRLHLPYDPRKLDEMLEKGQSIPVTNAPFQEWIQPAVREYTSQKAYNIGDFARTEYEGSDKTARLNLVRDYARDWEKAHGPSADTVID